MKRIPKNPFFSNSILILISKEHPCPNTQDSAKRFNEKFIVLKGIETEKNTYLYRRKAETGKQPLHTTRK